MKFYGIRLEPLWKLTRLFFFKADGVMSNLTERYFALINSCGPSQAKLWKLQSPLLSYAEINLSHSLVNMDRQWLFCIPLILNVKCAEERRNAIPA